MFEERTLAGFNSTVYLLVHSPRVLQSAVLNSNILTAQVFKNMTPSRTDDNEVGYVQEKNFSVMPWTKRTKTITCRCPIKIITTSEL